MHKLHLPRLGQTMERGTILRWARREGEPFEVGDILYEVESEKAVNEIEAKLPGTLARITVEEGQECPVGTLLAVVADPGETLSEEEIEAAIAEEGGREAPAASGGGTGVRAPSSARAQRRVRAMPKARALARELGVELAAVEGTGQGGAITVEDVRRAAGAAPGEGPRVRERRPLGDVGRTMARVVTRSWHEVPQFVQMVQLDASALVGRRRELAGQIKRSHGVDLSYTDLLLEAVAGAAGEEPLANSSLVDGEILLYEDVNVSVAVATGSGLLVPVVRWAQALELGELAARLREVLERARSGRLSAEDTAGGTITLSNLGMYGIEGGTPLVTHPQAAVVFAGAIVERPWAVSGRVEVRPTLTLSVGFDHRILDGVAAARFTTALRRRLESPNQEG
ncbi:catalytic domain of components of various dehydrogenase complexes [Rubrobacter xylanophilus DSM 9941]|uniref:Dihydrolipoamide acetyltransferase component of pyruvate dehydrogenase complex n=1 Tax=Rubrobacter xylanophilus (strain DSM 9941 / JCM 11954 / NBRC 16129 / PRD-1) TaxID=266117 RepID=Q1AZ52_RUBXD|nr:dihydrolipoamide acetyltransferase family protein [Rubrobacter xylanophilus]ABG03326.1 catalytic domain of components of various dehydrogenase complexes [Rubrobacter xylanophilus DSM 9941]